MPAMMREIEANAPPTGRLRHGGAAITGLFEKLKGQGGALAESGDRLVKAVNAVKDHVDGGDDAARAKPEANAVSAEAPATDAGAADANRPIALPEPADEERTFSGRGIDRVYMSRAGCTLGGIAVVFHGDPAHRRLSEFQRRAK